MLKKSKMSLAIAGAALMSAAGISNAVAAELPARIVPQAQVMGINNEASADRFVVKYKAGSAERASENAVTRSVGRAVSRAGLDRAVAATARTPARDAVQARFARRVSVAGWNLVTTDRKLNAQEISAFMRELQADPNVEAVELDHFYVRQNDAWHPNDPDYQARQWNMHNAVGGVRAPQAWALPNSRGQGVTVAVLDTGIVENHRDLAGNVIPGYDMLSHPLVSRREEGVRIPGGWDTGDYVEANYCGGTHGAENSSWHGSHVAGTIAQETDNSQGLAGLANGARVQPVRVLGACGGVSVDIADGITWASGGQVEGLPVNETPAQVLNLSLGSGRPTQCSQLYQDAINAANERGSIIVVAAGNSNANAADYTMGACQNVIVVGATGIGGGKAFYSSWGQRVDISAPGGGGGADGNPNGYIWQVINNGDTTPTDEWIMGGMIGTSMASPHVAAVVAMVQGALVAAERPLLNWQQMRSLLRSTASPFGQTIPASTPMGAGIVNAHAALTRAMEEPCDPDSGDCAPEAEPINNRMPKRGLSSNGEGAMYSFQAIPGRLLSISTSGGTGNVSMYVSFGAAPAAGNAQFSSTRPGNSEAVRIGGANVQEGTYYIKLEGNYSGVTLQVRQ